MKFAHFAQWATRYRTPQEIWFLVILAADPLSEQAVIAL